MSKIRKAKKLRQPNVPLAVGPQEPALPGAAEPRAASVAEPQFDYSYTRQDLTRIGMIAGSFIAVLVILSFFIK